MKEKINCLDLSGQQLENYKCLMLNVELEIISHQPFKIKN